MNAREERIAGIAAELMVDWRPGEAVVALAEEKGYRDWFWFTGLPADELEQWWRNLKSVRPYYYDPSEPPDDAEPLPGALVDVGVKDDRTVWEEFESLADYKAHMHTDEDSYLSKTVDSETVYIYHSGARRLT